MATVRAVGARTVVTSRGESFDDVLGDLLGPTKRKPRVVDPLAAGQVWDWTDRPPAPATFYKALAEAKRVKSTASVVLFWIVYQGTEVVCAARRPGKWVVNFRRAEGLPGVVLVSDTGKAAFFKDRESALAAIPAVVSGEVSRR